MMNLLANPPNLRACSPSPRACSTSLRACSPSPRVCSPSPRHRPLPSRLPKQSSSILQGNPVLKAAGHPLLRRLVTAAGPTKPMRNLATELHCRHRASSKLRRRRFKHLAAGLSKPTRRGSSVSECSPQRPPPQPNLRQFATKCKRYQQKMHQTGPQQMPKLPLNF